MGFLLSWGSKRVMLMLKEIKIIAYFLMNKILSIVILSGLENRYPCTRNKSLKIFGIIVELS